MLLLDADLDPLIAGKVLPLSPERITRVRIRLHAEVIQVVDTVASRRKLVGTEGASDGRRAERLQGALKALAGIEASRGGAVLLVSYKPVMAAMEPPEGVDRTWFGALRGLDGWKDHATVIVAGREQPPPREMEAAARAWFGDDTEPLLLTAGYVPCTRGYRSQGGERRGVEVEVHPDLRVQALLEQQREREIEQAVGRLRLVHRVRRARVLLLTNTRRDSRSTASRPGRRSCPPGWSRPSPAATACCRCRRASGPGFTPTCGRRRARRNATAAAAAKRVCERPWNLPIGE